MFEFKYEEKNIFKSNFTLFLKYREVEDKFQKGKYNMKTFFAISIVHIVLVIVYYILIFNNSNSQLDSAYNIAEVSAVLMFLISNLILILIIIVKKKDYSFFLFKYVSLTNIFSVKVTFKNIRTFILVSRNFDISSLVNINTIITIGSLEILIQFLYSIFIDSDYLVNLTANLAFFIFYYFSLVNFNSYSNFHYFGTIIFYLTINICIYFLEKNQKKFFYYFSILKKASSNLKNIFDHINMGVIVFHDTRITYINKYLKRIIDDDSSENPKLKRSVTMLSGRLEFSKKNDLLPEQSKDFILQNIEYSQEFLKLKEMSNKRRCSRTFAFGGNLPVDFGNIDKILMKNMTKNVEISNLKENLGNESKLSGGYSEILEILKRNQTLYSEFKIIGTKVITRKERPSNELDLSYQVYARYNEDDEQVEFLFNDITNISKIENYKAQLKYKTLFLSKVTHEFKNPLICIIELIKKININFLNAKASMKRVNSIENFQLDEDNGAEEGSSRSNMNVIVENEEYEREHSGLNENLNNIKNLSEFMMILIKDFDAMTTIEMNKELDINLEQIELEIVLKFCIDIFKTRADLNSKNIDFFYAVSKDVPKNIKTDEIRLKQILINLLSNSYKFTHSGKIYIEVEKQKDKTFRDCLCFKVTDTGKGIKKENQNLLTDPFCKLENKNNSYGTGLGLNIVKDMIVRLNNKKSAKLGINSVENEGTTMFFNIPILAEDGSDDEETIKTVQSEKNDSKNMNSVNLDVFKNKEESEHNMFSNDSLRKNRTRGYNIAQNGDGGIKLDRRSNSNDIDYKISVLKDDIETSLNNDNSIKLLSRNETRKIPFDLAISDKDKSELADDNLPSCNSPNESLMTLMKQKTYSKFNNKNIQSSNLIRGNDKTKASFLLSPEKKHREKASPESKFLAHQRSFKLESLARSSTKNLKRVLTKKESNVIFNGQTQHIDSKNNQTNNFFSERRHKSFSYNNNNHNKKTYNIILVEDEKLIRSSHLRLLESYLKSVDCEYEIIECTDGAECIYFIYEGLSRGMKYDAVISDESMFFIRGSLLCDILNGLVADNILYPIKIFIATSYETNSENVNFIKEKVNGIFNKPLSNANIQKICKTFLNL